MFVCILCNGHIAPEKAGLEMSELGNYLVRGWCEVCEKKVTVRVMPEEIVPIMGHMRPDGDDDGEVD